MRRALAGVLTTAYGVRALAVFSLLLVIATVLALLVPRLEWRRRITHRLAQLAVPVLGVRLVVEGLERLPPDSSVVVANHASYLDGVVMKAALPPRFSFVIKREAASMPLAGFLLKRIGSEFVDRHSAGGRHRDAMRVLRRAAQGEALVFFPEGTFDDVPGLKRFHVGARALAPATRQQRRQPNSGRRDGSLRVRGMRQSALVRAGMARRADGWPARAACGDRSRDG